MAIIVSARHGEYNWKINETGLSAWGKVQAEDLAHTIKNQNPDKSETIKYTLITSSAPRAIETGEIFCDVLNVPNLFEASYLWNTSENKEEHWDSSSDNNKLQEIIDAHINQENLIFLTHEGIAQEIAKIIIKKKNVHNFEGNYGYLREGSGIFIYNDGYAHIK